jgi:squalene synthase HpnC
VNLAEAYAACERLAREHYENFPVASRLLPQRMRPHVAALYAFARTADDFADEDGPPVEERHRLLDDWLARLRAALAAPSGGIRTDDARADRIFTALAHTVRTCDLPVGLLEDLVDAFRQDVTVRRYHTWADLFDYCRRSANPVGRLVLRIGGWRDDRLDRASDAICTALQLTNFWQDFEIDWSRGRLYLPLSERDAAGASDADLDRRDFTRPWRRAMARAVSTTQELFARGRPLCDAIPGRLRYELRATWLGGTRILEKLERQDFDVFAARPALTAADAMPLAWRLAAWRSGPHDLPRLLRTEREGTASRHP